MKWFIVLFSLTSSAYALQAQIVPKNISRGETFAVLTASDSTAQCEKYSLTFDDKLIQFLPLVANQCVALVGVHFKTEPRTHTLTLHEKKWLWESNNTINIDIDNGDYPSENLTVNKDFVKPPEATQKRIENEWVRLQAFYDNWQPYQEQLQTLALPVDSKVTSVFGTQRLINGELKSYHSGVDLRAGLGAKIKAAQAGKVILSEPLYYTGNHVAIDHGGGVITTYSHLNESLVQPGQMVDQGEVIGFSGATGRVTGAHLHWGAKVNTTTVSPMQLKTLLDELLNQEGVDDGQHLGISGRNQPRKSV